jgi:hypothetical protein
MAQLKAAARNRLPASTFGEPKERKYPMPDKSHAGNAAEEEKAPEKPKTKAPEPPKEVSGRGAVLSDEVERAVMVPPAPRRTVTFVPLIAVTSISSRSM